MIPARRKSAKAMTWIEDIFVDVRCAFKNLENYMIMSWFDAAEAKKFGDFLARFFVANSPSGKQFGEKAFEMKATKTLKQMTDHIAQFKSQHKLNTYKKAQLGNAFKWALKDAGIEPEYVDKLTKWLMLKVG